MPLIITSVKTLFLKKLTFWDSKWTWIFWGRGSNSTHYTDSSPLLIIPFSPLICIREHVTHFSPENWRGCLLNDLGDKMCSYLIFFFKYRCNFYTFLSLSVVTKTRCSKSWGNHLWHQGAARRSAGKLIQLFKLWRFWVNQHFSFLTLSFLLWELIKLLFFKPLNWSLLLQ